MDDLGVPPFQETYNIYIYDYIYIFMYIYREREREKVDCGVGNAIIELHDF